MSKAKTEISLQVLIEQCAINNQNEKFYRDINHATDEIIHDIFRYRKFNYGFSEWLECKSEDDNIGFVGPSYQEFLKSICLFLNIENDGEIVDDDSLTNKLNIRIARLSEITNESELKKEFPYLYFDLKEGRKYMAAINNYKQVHGEDEYAKESKHYFYRCGLKQSLKKFITTQVEVYRRFVNRREQYKEKTLSKNYNDYLMKYFDRDKIALYIVYSYLQSSKNAKEEDKINYYRIIEKYLKSNYNKDVIIKLNKKDITIKELVREYIKIRYDKDIDFTNINSLEELLDIVKQAQEEFVTWVIIPNGRDYSKTQIASTEYRQLKLPELELERLRKIGQEKNDFYEQTGYLAKVVGLKKYNGYIAYIYPNGEILIDREFSAKSPKSAVGSAIYNFRVEDFELLSRLDKTKLIHHPKVKRIIHSGNWQEKASDIIKKKGTEEDLEKSKQLIKKFQRQGK